MRMLTHLGRVTHIYVGKLTIIASDNCLTPGRRQAIIWTNAGILLIGPLGTNVNEILLAIHTFSFKKLHLNMSSAEWRPFCLGLNVLIMSPLKKPSPPSVYERVENQSLISPGVSDLVYKAGSLRFVTGVITYPRLYVSESKAYINTV